MSSAPSPKPKQPDIGIIGVPQEPSNTPDDLFRKEFHALDVAGKKQDIQQRKEFGQNIYFLVGTWIMLVYIMMLLQGFKSFTGFELSDKVMLTAIGSTTANVVGLLIVVMKYLFPVKK